MRKYKWSLLFLIGIIVCFSQSITAQDTTEKIVDSLYSKVMNEQRKIQIVLPEGYDANATDKYDVIYIIDGERNTDFVSQIYQYTRDWKFIPKNIIVGVENRYIDGVNQRNRDLTPTHHNSKPISGKADTYIAFFKDELIPYINKKFLTTGDNTLFGHSLGGAFSVYTLLKEPQLFKSYIASDPSLWWDNRYLSKLAAERLPELSDIEATLHIGGRKGGAYEGMGIVAMDSVLKLKAPKGLLWKSIDYPDEIHNSVKFKSVYDGLKLAYKGYTNEEITFHPMGGIVEKGKPFNIFLDSDISGIRYTTDGSEPTMASPIMDKIIVLNGPVKLKAKALSMRWNDNKTTTGQFIEGKDFKSKSKPKKAISGGLNYSYYEGEWDKLPDFKNLKPIKSGITNKDFDLKKLPSKNNFACKFEGYFEAKEDGYYAFAIASSDGSKFYIDNQLILDNDGIHNSKSFKSYMVPLKTGFYPIRLEYFQKDGDRNYSLIYLKPGSTDAIPLPLELQYYNK